MSLGEASWQPRDPGRLPSCLDTVPWTGGSGDSVPLSGSTGGTGQPQLTRQPGLEGCIHQLKGSKWWFLRSGPGRDLWGTVHVTGRASCSKMVKFKGGGSRA